MRVNFAHIRERSTTGGWIDFAVFDANSTDRTDRGRAEVLRDLTVMARASGYKVDKSALVYDENGQLKSYGASDIVEYLSDSGIPRWTHYLDT
jgi:hypothetical protein